MGELAEKGSNKAKKILNKDFVILDRFKKDNYSYAKVKFLETGNVDTFRTSQIKEGAIKDRFAKNVCGVACIGNATKVGNESHYTRWRNMIFRCYDKDNINFHQYGDVGIFVEDEWLCFENYLKDIVLLEGYDEDLVRDGILQIDKDLKCRELNIEPKRYGKNTCVWMTHSDNASLNKGRRQEYKNPTEPLLIATNIETGEIVEVFNIKDFSSERNITYRAIFKVLNGEQKQTKNWRFKRNE